MNEDEVLDELTKNYRIKRNEALAIISAFRSNFNKQRKKLNRGRLDNESLNEILHCITYACKDRENPLGDFRIIIKSFGDEKAKTPDPLYLAEKYENYKKLTEKFNVVLYKATDTYLKFRAMFNMQRALNGKKELAYQEMDTFIERIIPSYSSIDEFVKDTDDLKEGKGELMKLVCGNPLEDLVV